MWLKNQIDRLIDNEILNPKLVEQRLQKIPWTNEFTCGRRPVVVDLWDLTLEEDIGRQRSIPCSKVVLDGLLPEPEFEIWTLQD